MARWMLAALAISSWWRRRSVICSAIERTGPAEQSVAPARGEGDGAIRRLAKELDPAAEQQEGRAAPVALVEQQVTGGEMRQRVALDHPGARRCREMGEARMGAHQLDDSRL